MRVRKGKISALCACLALLLGCTPEESAELKEARLEREAHDRAYEAGKARDFAKLKQTGSCEGCNLYGTKWSAAQLRGANLRGANLGGGNCQGADLREADLRQASLGTDLSGADLRGAQIEETSFSGAILKGTRMDGLDLRTIRFADGTDWSGAILRGADLRGVSFFGSHGDLHRTKPASIVHVGNGGTALVGTDLREADLRDASFISCNLQRADLRGADLRGTELAADLAGADLTGAKRTDNQVCGAGSIGKCVLEPDPSAPAPAKPRRKLLR
jgi:uncharacterized protein YjbI with pentapeptide repeats